MQLVCPHAAVMLNLHRRGSVRDNRIGVEYPLETLQHVQSCSGRRRKRRTSPLCAGCRRAAGRSLPVPDETSLVGRDLRHEPRHRLRYAAGDVELPQDALFPEEVLHRPR